MLRVRLPIIWEQLRIREMTVQDLDFIADMLGNEEVMAYSHRPLDRDEALDWFWINRHATLATAVVTSCWDTELGCPVGQVGLLAIAPRGRTEISLGYLLHRSFWNCGDATRSGEQLVTTPSRTSV